EEMSQFSDTPYALIRGVQTKQPILYIVRHGATGDDDSYNSPENPKLTEKGKQDAEAAAKFFSDKKIGNIYASVYRRSTETAETIGKELNKKVQPDEAIDSLDVGDVSKLPSADEADKVIKHHQANKDKQIPGGESINDFHER